MAVRIARQLDSRIAVWQAGRANLELAMDTDYSLASFMSFMDYLSDKHILNKNTAQSRKAAANKVFAVLDETEAADLRKLDMEMVYRRFENKEGRSYKPETLQVYRSRLGTALSDFLSHAQSPGQFKPTVKTSLGARSAPAKKVKKAAVPAVREEAAPQTAVKHQGSALSIPVPLREGVTVMISGVPADLSEAEASRLAAIMKAYAMT